MKRTTAFILVIAVLFSLCSCAAKRTGGDTEETDPVSVTETTLPEVVTEDSLTLEQIDPASAAVVYFSLGDPVEDAAKEIAKQTGASVFRIETEKPYPEDPLDRAEVIKAERENNVRPKLKSTAADLSGADIVFIGFPVWEGTLPMAVCTFLEDHDLYGKAVIPFCYAENGAAGSSLNDISALCRLDVMTLCYVFDTEKPAEKELTAWLDGVLYGS